MKIITVDSKAYQNLKTQIDQLTADSKELKKMQEQIDRIAHFVYNVENPNVDRWVNNDEAIKLLGISKRTLQNLRTEGSIKFGIFRGKCRYKLFEVERVLEELTASSCSNTLSEWKKTLNK